MIGLRSPSAFAVAALLALVTFASCSSADISQSKRSTSELRIAEQGWWDGFGFGQYQGGNGHLISSCLLDIGPGGALVPNLAARVPSVENGLISADNLTIDYPLRRNARWQDGAPLTAADVVFTFAQILNPRNNLGATFPYPEVQSVTAISPYRLRVRMKRVFAPIVSMFFTGYFCLPIIPYHLLSHYKDLNVIPFNDHPIYSGPYRLAEWKRGDRVTYSANQYFYFGKPLIERIVDLSSPDHSTNISQLRTGELDAIFAGSPMEATALAGDPSLTVRVSPTQDISLLTFNTTDSVMSDRRMRNAIALAIDRSTIARKVSYGYYDASNPSKTMWDWAYDDSSRPPSYDPQKASGILDELGWTRSGDHIRTKHGHPLELTLAMENEGLNARVGVFLQGDLRRVGIDVVIKTYSASTFLGEAKTGGIVYGGRFQMYYGTAGFGGLDEDFSEGLSCAERAPLGDNTSRICDKQLDTLLAAGVSTFDRRLRKHTYAQEQRLLNAELPRFPLWVVPRIDIYTRRLKNFIPSPNSVTFYHPERWTLSAN